MSVGFQESELKPLDRYMTTVVIAAAIIAAVRIAKRDDGELTMQSVATTVTQSVLLARTILDEARRLL